MYELKAYRNNLQDEKYVADILQYAWNREGCDRKYAFRCNSVTADALIRSFAYTQMVYYKYNLIKLHCFEIMFGFTTQPEEVEYLINVIANGILSDFQIYVVVYGKPVTRALFLVNATSISGYSFHDNNQMYKDILQELNNNCNVRIKFKAADSLMFGGADVSDINYMSCKW